MYRTHYSSQITQELNGQRVKVAGWVWEIKDLGGIKFLWIRDREGIVQITAPPKKKVTPEIFKLIPKLKAEDVVAVEGVVNFTPKAKLGFEVLPEKLEVLSKAESPPLPPRSDGGEGEGRARHEARQQVHGRQKARGHGDLQDTLQRFQSCEGLLLRRGFHRGPHTQDNRHGHRRGGTELFPMRYFERDAFLAQSPPSSTSR